MFFKYTIWAYLPSALLYFVKKSFLTTDVYEARATNGIQNYF